MPEEITREIVKGKLDVLFDNVQSYRSSSYFKSLLEFCANFKTLAPYNAMLVRFQMPGARFVLTASEWKRLYNRGIKPDAQPLVILVPFGPIAFVFEIKDTYPLGDKIFPYTDEDILRAVQEPFKTRGDIDQQIYNNLISNLAYHGIAYNSNMNAGVGYGGKLQLLSSPSNHVIVHINRVRTLRCIAGYLISTNSQASETQRFSTIVHELGHFFCQHLPAPTSWNKKWTTRNLQPNAEEFEAQAVSWLICERLNIFNSSERYLSGYMEANNEIPNGVSVDHIFSAFNKIWDICSRDYYPYKDGMLYKHDEHFQNTVKSILLTQ